MKKGDIGIVDLTAGFGHEQFGERPAIILCNTNGIAIVIPLTANHEALRFSYTLSLLSDKQNNLKQESVALIFHIKAIDQKRILKIIGKINKKSQKKIDNLLRKMLEL